MSRFEIHYAAVGDFERILAERRVDLERDGVDDPEAAARRWTEEGRDLAVEVLDEMEASGMVERLDSALGRPVYTRPDGGERLFNLLMPELGRARSVARMLGARAAQAALRGDGAAYADEIGRLYGLADAVGRTPTVISALVGTAIRGVALERIRLDLIAGRLDARACDSVLRVMDAWASERLDWAVVLESERLMGYSLLQASHTDSGGGDGRVLLHLTDGFGMTGGPPSPPPNWGNAVGVFMATKRQSRAKLDSIYDGWLEIIDLPYGERRAAAAAIEGVVERLGPRYMVVGMITPALSRWLDGRDSAEVREGAVRLMLAVEVYRDLHGGPPGTLRSLVPEILDALPRDPFAADGAFGYRIAPDRPMGYVLYSVGFDGVDDGGEPRAGKEWDWAVSDDDSAGDAVFSERAPIRGTAGEP